MAPKLIGLTGRARSGKDLAGKFFAVRHGYERYALASPIKRGLEAMLNLTQGTCDDDRLKEEPISWLEKSPRQMMQTLGTEWGRELVHPEIWLRLMRRHWLAVQAMGLPGMVITDVRFDNEAEMVRKLGGKVVCIVRDSAPAVAGHSSEHGVFSGLIDAVISNNDSPEALAKSIDSLVRYSL